MKKTILVFICALALGLGATASAAPIAITDTNYLGYIDPGAPADATNEALFINAIRSLSLGELDPLVNLGNPQDPYTAYRSWNVFASLPAASAVGADSNNGYTGGTLQDVTGWQYLLVKFGNTSHVWVLDPAATIDIEIPAALGTTGGGTSHYSLYNYSGVPDGGATLMLLGGALVGLGALRRKFGV